MNKPLPTVLLMSFLSFACGTKPSASRPAQGCALTATNGRGAVPTAARMESSSRVAELLCQGEAFRFELVTSMRAPSDDPQKRAQGGGERFEGDATLTTPAGAKVAHFSGTRFADYAFLGANTKDNDISLTILYGEPQKAYANFRDGKSTGFLRCSGPLMTEPPLK